MELLELLLSATPCPPRAFGPSVGFWASQPRRSGSSTRAALCHTAHLLGSRGRSHDLLSCLAACREQGWVCGRCQGDGAEPLPPPASYHTL